MTPDPAAPRGRDPGKGAMSPTRSCPLQVTEEGTEAPGRLRPAWHCSPRVHAHTPHCTHSTHSHTHIPHTNTHTTHTHTQTPPPTPHHTIIHLTLHTNAHMINCTGWTIFLSNVMKNSKNIYPGGEHNSNTKIEKNAHHFGLGYAASKGALMPLAGRDSCP